MSCKYTWKMIPGEMNWMQNLRVYCVYIVEERLMVQRTTNHTDVSWD